MAKGTVDAVGAVVLRAASGPRAWQVLLIQRARPPAKGSWTLPGGHVEPGETLEQAVRREVEEETGLAVDVVAFLETFELRTPDRTYAIHEHLCRLSPSHDGATLRPSDDAAEAIWAAEEDLATLAVSPDACVVIARAVALTRDRKTP